ncbi:hypothetical protein NONI108955_20815 [Nocardia ninae]|uniref:Uncharacterized protein n=1 Tax=Nocardia ninae NBRC 108245 TaxID=1210091 RepID=A0A511MBD1_9NOCA|nr:hypothetical protein [Nocardia ninae]GEM37398.1 hypothetical protein NN4_19170 [Nocardia ninae NBRC 108245]
MPQLNTFVHVQDEDGTAHEFGPNTEVPAWAIALITNPDVWEVPPVAEEPAFGFAADDKPEIAEATPKRTTRKPATKSGG